MKLGIQLRLIIITFFILTVNGVFAQIVSYSNEYLKIGSSARATAMGNAVTSVTQGAEALYYNPANIANLTNSLDILATHSEYFGNTANFDFISIAYKTDSVSAIAAGFVRMGIDNIPNTLYIYNNGIFDLNQIRYFSVSDNALFIGYSRQLNPRIKAGGNLKLIYRHQGEFANAYGFGLDAALSYKYGDWLFSAVAKDALGTYTAWFFRVDSLMSEVFSNTNNELPHNKVEITLPWITISAARQFTIKQNFHLKVDLELVNYLEGRGNGIINTPLFNSSPQLGVEADFKKIIYLRAGAYNFQKIPYYRNGAYSSRINFFPTLGVGLKYKKVRFDYSFDNFYNPGFSLGSHFFSVLISLDNVKIKKPGTNRRL